MTEEYVARIQARLASEEDELVQSRLQNLLHLVQDADVAPHPDRFETTHTLTQAAELPEGTAGVRIAGRIKFKRDMGSLTFARLEDFHGGMQISLQKKGLAEDVDASRALYKLFSKRVDLWDFVGIEGEVYRTRKGELTVQAKSWTFLGKCLQPPAGKFHGSRDTEANWRKRYVDLVSNDETRARFRLRTKITRALRDFLDAARFDEVETPVLCTQASGALARPFLSHHNAMDMQVVMRIAPETYLKRLVVGGYERVYEFARCFRNEGMDPSHLQDFTMLEFYAAYWNYEDNMRFTEEMIRHVVEQATGSLVVKRGDREIDFGQPWPRQSLREVIQTHAGLDILDYPDAESLRKKIFELKIELENPDAGRGSLIDQLYKRTARPNLIQPMFLIRHPVDLSPLARRSDDDVSTSDRFQLVVDSWEVVNAYSELVDPLDQRERLEEQAQLRGAGDDEAMELDDDYLLAMEHGMPPISGWGMGIDRFVALIADAPNLRDVVWFPLLKPAVGAEGEPQEAQAEAPAES